MAIGFNAQTNLTSTTAEASWSFNHTCAGSDRLVVVFVSAMRNTADGISISTCTFGGTNMTLAVTRGWNDSGRTRSYRESIYYMVNPGTSQASVAVTTNTNSSATAIAAVSLTGVLQASPLGGSYSADISSSTNATTTVTATTTNAWLVGGAMMRKGDLGFTPGTDVTEFFDLSTGSDATLDISAVGGYKVVPSAGSLTINFTAGGANYGVIVAAEFKPAATATTHTATAADGLDLTDATARRGVYRPTAGDGLRGTEATARRAIYRRTAGETLALLAALSPRRALRAAAVESLGMSGGMGPRRTRRPVLVDLLDLLEAAAGGGRVTALASDALDVTATTGARWTLRRVAADTWRLTEATAGRRDRRATAADGLELHEAASYPLPGGGGSLRVLPSADGREDGEDGGMALLPAIAGMFTDHSYALKFNNPDIPADATIETAYLEFYPYNSDDPNVTIAAEQSAAPDDLAATDYNISSRSPTDASTAWSAANVGLGQYVVTADFSEVVQEIVALPEWQRGTSDLLLILVGLSSSFLNFYGLTGTHPPYLNIAWTSGGLTITAEATDLLDLLDDADRRALIAAATADSVSWAAASTVALSLLVAESWQLSEMVLTLARLRVADEALLGDGVYLAYALSLTEPLTLQIALQRIATARVAPVDALKYSAALQTKVNTSAGDALELDDALAARRLLAAIVHDAAAYAALLDGDMPGLLDAIVNERIALSGAAKSGWRGRVAAGDALAADETLATLRRFAAAVVEAGLWDDVAAATKRTRPVATDAARLVEMLGTRSAARAADTLEWSAATVERLLSILRAVAADGLELSAGTAVAWRVTARDSLEFAAALGRIIHWVAAAGDEWGLHDVAVTLLPNGIVRIELAMMRTSVAFEIAMPRADVALRQPSVVIEPHGLTDR